MTHRTHDIGIARRVGAYSDAVEVPHAARWLITSGTPGIDSDGSVPDGITHQAELAWHHVLTMLDRAGMTVEDIVKVTQYLIDASDIADYVSVRTRMLGDARPASMLLVVPALVRPAFRVEVEIVAARSSA